MYKIRQTAPADNSQKKYFLQDLVLQLLLKIREFVFQDLIIQLLVDNSRKKNTSSYHTAPADDLKQKQMYKILSYIAC
jgi:hypothetical protein